ncbi:MAG: transglutaminase family protein [Chromatiaceae bacterium]|nr:transglutaminase family protein [Chromatiaceae bacterium]
MKYRITHLTQYDYSEPVSLCHNLAHLKPRTQPGQTCFASQVKVEPTPAVAREYRDFFQNQVKYFALQQAHQQLKVTAVSDVEVRHQPISSAEALRRPWEAVREGLCQDHPEACLLTLDSPYIRIEAALRDYAAPSFPPGRPYLEAIRELNHRIYTDFTYDPNFTEVATPMQEVLEHRRGVCQDFAHVAIGCVRALGLPARYVSGYLETLPPPGSPKLRGADASHAWFAVYLPGEGWVDFDPTNDQMPEEQHITTAVGRDFGDVTPVRGVLYGGGEHSLSVSVDVERLE